jgi:hypothetical protein
LHNRVSSESNWSPETYDDEFLEHLFICSILAKSQSDLMLDIGFGRNMLELIEAALRFDSEREQEDVFQFAPFLVQRLHLIIHRVMTEHQESPWILARYHLKNKLQRDPLLPKHQLTPEFLDKLLEVLLEIGPAGCREERLRKKFPPSSLETWLQVLQRCELIYPEGPAKKGGLLSYALSRSGSECSSVRFAFDHIQKGLKGDIWSSLSASYQAALIQAMAIHQPETLPLLPWGQLETLKPEALRLLIEIWKKQKSDETLLEFFQNLLHNQPHAWIRAEICLALPLARQTSGSRQILENLAQHDPSPMVRHEAREALSRTQECRP